MTKRDMIRSLVRPILIAWMITVSLSSSPAHSYEKSYDLTDTSGTVFFLGDVIKISTGWCAPKKKLPKSLAGKRLQIYKSGK